MNRDEFHVATSTAVAVEGLIASGRVGVDEAARRAILFGRSNGMTDWADDQHVKIVGWKKGDPRTVTQQQASRGIRLMSILGKSWNRNFEAVDRRHFSGPQDIKTCMDILPFLAELNDDAIMEIAMLYHDVQDSGIEGCPHWGYSGVPSRDNYLRTKELGQLPWWHGAMIESLTWGHCLDKEADNIERCREGAVKTTTMLYEWVRGKDIERLGGRPFHPGTADHVTSILAVQVAHNDADLHAMQAVNFKEATGLALPPFAPFEGEQLRTWFKLARKCA